MNQAANMTLYGYRIHVWNSIYHNDKYSHPTMRQVTLHLLEPESCDEDVVGFAAIMLALPQETTIHDGTLTIRTSGEYIHSVDRLGIATPRVVFDYKKKGA